MSAPDTTFPETNEQLIVFAERLADLARAQTAPRFRQGAAVENKSGADFDPVTDADREAERVIRLEIERTYPDHGILGEEFGVTNEGASTRWVLDPVDGTRAFVCGVPSWATLIAFETDGEPQVSVIDQAYTDERWIGSSEATYFAHNGERRRCQTSGVTDLAAARISTSDPRASAYFTPGEAGAFEALAAATRLARFSLDAYAYALLASGEFDIVLEAGLQHYDYAALAPVIRGAGGVITDWSGAPFDAGKRGRTLAAATPALHAAALELLADCNFEA